MRAGAVVLLVLASACGISPYRMSAPLEQTQWKLVALNGRPVGGDRPPTVLFESNEQRVLGFTGCNRLAGPYRVEGDDLTIGPLAVTKMACPDMDGERAFVAALEAARHYAIAGRNLALIDAGGTPLAQFSPTSSTAK
jgi:heat shock protein HslJ